MSPLKEPLPAYLRSLDKWLMVNLDQKELEIRDIHYFLSELVRGAMKVTYDKSDEVILQYLDIICSGQLLKDIKNINKEVLDGGIIKFIRSMKIDV